MKAIIYLISPIKEYYAYVYLKWRPQWLRFNAQSFISNFFLKLNDDCIWSSNEKTNDLMSCAFDDFRRVCDSTLLIHWPPITRMGKVVSVLSTSPLLTFFLGLSPVLCLMLFAQSVYMFILGYRKLAITFLVLTLLLSIPTLILTYILSK